MTARKAQSILGLNGVNDSAMMHVAAVRWDRKDKTKRRVSDEQGRRCYKGMTEVRASAPEIYDLWWAVPAKKTDRRNKTDETQARHR